MVRCGTERERERERETGVEERGYRCRRATETRMGERQEYVREKERDERGVREKERDRGGREKD